MTDVITETRICTRCGARLPIDNFYFVSRKLGTRRGQCKECMSEMKRLQKNPDWLPTCARCGRERERVGPGRRLCKECFEAVYESEIRYPSGASMKKLKPCSSCGEKRLPKDHIHNASLCPICRSVPQGRRASLKKFNMNPREYVALLDSQGHCCAICGKKPKATLNIDHKHSEPMLVRGLLCGRCNTLIGLARDSLPVLEGAQRYLENPTAQRLFPGRVTTIEANRHHEGYRYLSRSRKAAKSLS